MKEDLWQGRRLRLLLSPDSPVWAHGKVSKIEQVENDGIFVEMEFEAETPKKMQQCNVLGVSQPNRGSHLSLRVPAPRIQPI